MEVVFAEEKKIFVRILSGNGRRGGDISVKRDVRTFAGPSCLSLFLSLVDTRLQPSEFIDHTALRNTAPSTTLPLSKARRPLSVFLFLPRYTWRCFFHLRETSVQQWTAADPLSFAAPPENLTPVIGAATCARRCSTIERVQEPRIVGAITRARTYTYARMYCTYTHARRRRMMTADRRLSSESKARVN